jgi:co-chaperonin GroES (HSP10)
MIDTIDPKTAIIPTNFCLIKADISYDFHEIPTPDGKVSIQLSYFNQDKSKYLSISGTVLMLPKEKWFFSNKADGGEGDEFNAMVRNSLEFDANCDIKVGDKVFFDYREQIDCETERRLVRTADYGLCVLVRLDRLYGVYENDDLRPVNGYVFFLRDQLPDKLELSNGILLSRNHNKYGLNTGTVLAADAPVRQHLENEEEPNIELAQGDRIQLMKNRGFRISYEVGNEDLRDIEIVHRKDIWGDWNDILSIVREYEANKLEVV